MVGVDRLLAVVAHPDDESFALGALLDRVAGCGVATAVLCFTHGEASTLHGRPGDLRRVRARELQVAAGILGVARVELLDYPDGRLDDVPVPELAGHVGRLIEQWRPTHLLVFDEGGVTGHRDHQQATRAAMTAARSAGITVLAWTLPESIAERLNATFGTAFAGRRPGEIDARVSVSRGRQRRAIAAHASQSAHNPVLARRLTLLRDTEHLRVIR